MIIIRYGRSWNSWLHWGLFSMKDKQRIHFETAFFPVNWIQKKNWHYTIFCTVNPLNFYFDYHKWPVYFQWGKNVMYYFFFPEKCWTVIFGWKILKEVFSWLELVGKRQFQYSWQLLDFFFLSTLFFLVFTTTDWQAL